MSFPAMRHVEASTFEHEGQTMICLRDPEGFATSAIALSPGAFFIATLLDGERGAEEIQAEFTKQTEGQSLAAEDIERVVSYLDEEGYLLSEKLLQRIGEVQEAFEKAPNRPAHLAGQSYPVEPEALRNYLDQQFLREGGPGAALEDGEAAGGLPIRGLIAPHIDLERGGASYAHAYLRMARAPRPETVIVFGVAHHSPPVPFVLTRKGYETPLGTLEADLPCTDSLAAACPYDAYEHETVHRTEHSIEFQALMLAHLFPENPPKIVPILCGTFAEGETLAEDPEQVEAAKPLLAKCREMATESDGRICIIAGVDLAHIGKCFGDDFDIDEDVVRAMAARDQEDLAKALALDGPAWFQSVMQDGNARRVCGINAIYAMLVSLDGACKQAELHHYGYAPDPSGGIVSFAAVSFT
jgi:hypothetical protein